MKFRHVLGVVAVCLVVAPLFAQTNVPATREDVLKLFDVMKIHEQMTSVMSTIAAQQREMIVGVVAFQEAHWAAVSG